MKNFCTRPIAIVFATLALLVSACACTPQQSTTKKINLGKQLASITLTTGNNNDLNITPSGGSTTIIRLVPNASGSTLTGMASASVSDGDLFLIRNEGTSGNITITNADTSSTVAADRFVTPNSSSVILLPHAAAWAEWDSTATAWILSPVQSAGDGTLGTATVTGHIKGTGTAPALTSCGTSPAIAGSDLAGVVTTGSAATTCTITFAATYTTAPSCFFLPTGTATMPVYTVSATAITVTTDIASTVYNYGCVGH
jgi:hypothetical protein